GRRRPRGARRPGRRARRRGGELLYAWLFRHLPRPLAVRILLAVLLIAAVVVVLFGWVFPAIAPLLPVDEGVVDALPAELRARS
ncbi:hypothetical protein NPM19_33065, partial [Bacillus cereus]